MKKIYLLICILFAALLTTTAVWAGEKTQSGMEFDVSTPADASDDSSDVYARLLVIDPLGNKTGYDPSIGAEVSQIPQSGHFKERIGDIQTGEPGLEGYTIGFDDPIAGEYILQIVGINRTTKYTLGIRMADNAGNSHAPIFNGLTGSGVVSEFKITYDPTPGFIPKIEKAVTIDDIRSDINIAYTLILIDNPGIKQSLLSKVNVAEQAISKGQKQTAINQLNAFINEVNAQKDKHIKEYAVKILLAGAHYLIEHL